MKCKIIVLGLLCLFVTNNVLTGQLDFGLDSLFNRWENSKVELPGLAAAIIKGDKVVYRNAHGYANLEYNVPLSTKSVFDLASLAKQFTGLAVAQLVVIGKLNVEDHVSDYLPGMGAIFKNIKIKHLVYHTSGLRDIGELFGLGLYGGQLTSTLALRILQKQDALNFKSGMEYDYSNSNYVLLSLIVESVSGDSFRDYCHNYIFKPLGMKKTFVNDNPLELIKNRASAYYTNGGIVDFYQENGMYLTGSSAVFSTLDDMVIWAKAIQSESIFSDAIRLMKRKGLKDNGESVGYGFGLGLGESNGVKHIEHTGATPAGFRSQITWLPGQEIAIILLSNWGNIDLSNEFGSLIIDHFSNENQETENPIVTEESPVAVKLSLAESNLFVGKYLFNDHMRIEITNDGGLLKVQPEGQPLMDLVPLNDSTLQFPAFRSTLHFSKVSGYESAAILQGPNKVGGLRKVEDRNTETHPLSELIGKYFSPELEVYFEISHKGDSVTIYNTKYGKINMDELGFDLFRIAGGIDAFIKINRDVEGVPVNFILSRGSRMRDVKFVRFQIDK